MNLFSGGTFYQVLLVRLEQLQNNRLQGKCRLYIKLKKCRIHIDISVGAKLEKAWNLRITRNILHCTESHSLFVIDH